ncbi:unnamed protein product [Mycena citricolor]|uniref:Uncharacterized protein n=1 Tax=Mycena citricolor TaxID=2018698 RepID=A0AAD2Q0Y1_9AGAR|nr:unnamed protein product [Mycena citricolor]
MWGNDQNPNGTPISLNGPTPDTFRPQFESFVSGVIESEFQSIVPAYKLSGGWEKWFHAELCVFINHYAGAPGFKADREPPVYPDSGFADIALEDPATGAVSHVVEIKCSLKTETAARANQRAGDDITKLGGNPKTGKKTELKVNYAGAAKIVLLLVVDDVVPDTIPWDAIQDEDRPRLF